MLHESYGRRTTDVVVRVCSQPVCVASLRLKNSLLRKQCWLNLLSSEMHHKLGRSQAQQQRN
jgi:hypothetical protein